MNMGPWQTIKFGVFLGIGLIAAYGVIRLVLWLLNMIFGGGGADLPW